MRQYAACPVIVLIIAICGCPAFAQTAVAPSTSTSAPAPKPKPASKAKSNQPGAIRLRVEGEVGYTSYTASQSFKAILGKSTGLSYGGGGGVLIGQHLFVEAKAESFKGSGERVFIGPNQQLFSLGIPLQTRIMPIDVSAGWRFAGRPPLLPLRSTPTRIVPFVGGGIGVVKYTETAQFAQTGDDVHDTFTSYHVIGGAEFAVTRHIGVIGDARYRWVPKALGTAGVSKSFGETDLGGLVIGFRGIYTF